MLRDTSSMKNTPHAPTPAEAAKTLNSAGVFYLRVFGASMLPTVWPGDVLVVHPVKLEAVETGEILLYSRDHQLIAHRAVARNEQNGEPVLITRGDSLRVSDPPVRSPQVVGRIAFILRGNSTLRPARTLGPAARIIAWLAQRSTLFLRILLRLLRWLSTDSGAMFLIYG